MAGTHRDSARLETMVHVQSTNRHKRRGCLNKLKEEPHMSTHEIESKIRELREMQALVEEAQAEIEALKDTLKAAMGDLEELSVGEYKLTYRPVTTPRIDTAALKKALPDLAAQFTKETTTRRFCVA